MYRGVRARHAGLNELQDGPRVLHDLSFEVKTGERIGIGELTRTALHTRVAQTSTQSDGQAAAR